MPSKTWSPTSSNPSSERNVLMYPLSNKPFSLTYVEPPTFGTWNSPQVTYLYKIQHHLTNVQMAAHSSHSDTLAAAQRAYFVHLLDTCVVNLVEPNKPAHQLSGTPGIESWWWVGLQFRPSAGTTMSFPDMVIRLAARGMTLTSDSSSGVSYEGDLFGEVASKDWIKSGMIPYYPKIRALLDDSMLLFPRTLQDPARLEYRMMLHFLQPLPDMPEALFRAPGA